MEHSVALAVVASFNSCAHYRVHCTIIQVHADNKKYKYLQIELYWTELTKHLRNYSIGKIRPFV